MWKGVIWGDFGACSGEDIIYLILGGVGWGVWVDFGLI